MRWIGLGLLAAVAGVAAAQGFSVEQALSAPFSNQLTAAPAKARVAWFTDAEGRRNVWIAGTHEAARQVTHYTADDGQDIDDLAWSADAERIAWTRGTGAQGSEHTMAANPAELPGPVKQSVEFADLRTGAVRVMAEGHAPLFLLDGSALLFLRRGNIWVADLGPHGTGTSAKPMSQDRDIGHTGEPGEMREAPGVRQLVYVRGSASGLRLSPDGRLLLFVSNRGDHSFIGVFDLATKQLRWIDPGVGIDHDAAWSPDGKRIAFVREVPIVSAIADRWMREGAPWSIRVADVATGAGSELWRADAGAGSVFHGVTSKDQLHWTNDGRIVFPWEKAGWTRLYAVHAQPPAGAKAQPEAISPEDAEVDCVASRGDRIVWSSNDARSGLEDVDRRHIFSDGGSMLTGGKGIETEPAILSDGTFAMMRGGTGKPLVPGVLVEQGNVRDLAPELVPPGFSALRFVAPRQVIFPAADGQQVHGQLFLPSGHKPGERLPAVVFFHGGSRRQMLLGFHPMQYYAQAYEFNQYLASRGFAVLSVNYRSGTGYGLNFRQALNYGANGASEYNDVVGAARYLQGRDDIDGKRIGAWGGSYGGYLTALALARNSDLYAAGVDLHGVHDWSLELDLWKPVDDPDADQPAIARRAYASSPMADVKRWRSPVLLIQGDDDRNVLFSQTVRLAAALRAEGVPVEEKIFPDEVHDFLLHRNWITSYELAAGFLEKNLKSR